MGFWMLLLLSCSDSEKVPRSFIGKEKMGDILFDISLSEGHMEAFHFKDSAKNRDSLLITDLEKVLSIHQVSKEQFLESYRFYLSHPAIYKAMADSMQAKAQRNQDKMYGRKRPRKAA